MKSKSSISNQPKQFKTEDGYTFYLMPDGRLVDNLDPNLVDLSYDSIEEFENDPLAVNTLKEV